MNRPAPTNEAIRMRNEMSFDLKENILPYWMTRMVDNLHGGFLGRRDGYDVPDIKADKAIILNTRILWTFSHAVNNLPLDYHGDQPRREAYQEMALRAYEYIVSHFLDTEKGGVYWMVSYNGKPVSTKKQIYAQAFAIYALSEYFLASKNTAALDLAVKLFYLIEQFSFDTEYNGYYEAFDRNWNLLEDLRLSEKDANEKKTMNTHLHILEAYTNLYRCWKDEKLRLQLKNLILVFHDKIINDQLQFQLFFDEEWRVKNHPSSFGHDIEGSWLLYEAAEELSDEELIKTIRAICVGMVDISIREGLDEDGGLMYEGNHGQVTDTDKHWWPQAEAIVGLVNAWQLTGNDDYLGKAVKVWTFIKRALIDKDQGEWHWKVSRSGIISREEDKAGPWKCPYHNGRAAMEMLKRLQA